MLRFLGGLVLDQTGLLEGFVRVFGAWGVLDSRREDAVGCGRVDGFEAVDGIVWDCVMDMSTQYVLY